MSRKLIKCYQKKKKKKRKMRDVVWKCKIWKRIERTWKCHMNEEREKNCQKKLLGNESHPD